MCARWRGLCLQLCGSTSCQENAWRPSALCLLHPACKQSVTVTEKACAARLNRPPAEAALSTWLQRQAAQGWTLVGLEQTAESAQLQASRVRRAVPPWLPFPICPLPAWLPACSPTLQPACFHRPITQPTPSPPPPMRAVQDFVFPPRTVLVLGREKEGIPADLLPLLHHTVEIPQRGVIRSLNVHVSGAIAMWECTRQGLQSSGGGGCG